MFTIKPSRKRRQGVAENRPACAGFIGIDRKARDVFLAMRSRQRVTAWPAVDRWPAPLRTEYESWRKIDR